MIELSSSRYGKAAIRIVRVGRDETPHRLRDITVAVALEGDLAASYTDGDNASVVATDTMKNTAYAFAAEHLTGAIETYATDLARHFLDAPQVDRATVNVREHAWRPIDIAGTPAPDAFVRRGGDGTRVATVAATRGAVMVESGIEDLVVMKTSRSAFSGFPRDRYTTLADTEDRLMATKVTAVWRYGSPDIDFDATDAVCATLLEVFADHDSPSVQTSIWIMAQAMLARHEELDEVRMVLPNLHHWPADLSPFGMDNDRLVYVSTTEPHGMIEATVRRNDPAP